MKYKYKYTYSYTYTYKYVYTYIYACITLRVRRRTRCSTSRRSPGPSAGPRLNIDLTTACIVDASPSTHGEAGSRVPVVEYSEYPTV